jgi:hypothetical protein
MAAEFRQSLLKQILLLANALHEPFAMIVARAHRIEARS